MRIFSLILKRSRGLLLTSVFVGVLSGACGTALIGLVNHALDREAPAATAVLGWVFLGLCVLRLATSVLSQHFFHRLSQNVAFDLRTNLSRQVLKSPLRKLEQEGPSRILAALTNDVTVLVGTFVAVPALIIDFTIVVGCLAYMGWLSLPLFGTFLLFVVLGVVSYRLPLLWGHSWFVVHRRRHDTLYEHFDAVTRGTKELKLHYGRRRKFLDEDLTGTARQLRGSAIAAGMIFGAAATWGQLLLLVFIGLTIFVLEGVMNLGLGVVQSSVFLIFFMNGALRNLVLAVPRLSRAIVSARNVESLGLSFEQQDLESPPREPAPSTWRRLELAGITHTYFHEADGSHFDLGPIDLTVEPGELVFIVGGNGSGKTTLAKLVTGLYTPEAGEIRIDGEVVGEEGLEEYRQLFSTVFWDFHLFRELPGLDRSAIEEHGLFYLEKLRLEKKVEIHDGELSTTALSQGQMKRLALLVAYLEDRPIYLFDEWAADQDPTFKDVFYRQLLPELRVRGKTVLVISHDDRYFDVADRIVKLENGKIVGEARGSKLRLDEGAPGESLLTGDSPGKVEAGRTKG